MRQRLALSLLTGRPVEITDIRIHDDSPGICGALISFPGSEKVIPADYETALLRLVQRISNGSSTEINRTGAPRRLEFVRSCLEGTRVLFVPGILHGGDMESFECPTERCISYYAEMVLMIAPFCKVRCSCFLFAF